MSSRYSACFSFTGPNISSRSTCEKPMIAFSGVRSSCDMLARNSDLCRLAASSSVYRRLSSSFIRLTFAASAPSSSRLTTSTCPEKSPDAIAARRASIRWIGPISDHERTNPRIRARTIAADRDADEQVSRALRTRGHSGRSGHRSSRVVPLASSLASCLRSIASCSARGAAVARLTAPSGSLPVETR